LSKPSSGDLSQDDLPPGWDSLAATTPGGFIYVAVWRKFPDMTQLELDCALTAPLGSPTSLSRLDVPRVHSLAGNAVATVGVLRAARRERLDLSDDQWERLVRRIWPHLNAEQRLNPQEILAELALTHPVPQRRELSPDLLAASAPTRRKPGPTLIVDRQQVERCRTALRAAGKLHGHRAVARALVVSVSTVRRRLAGH
jgi:hypothetical protein